MMSSTAPRLGFAGLGWIGQQRLQSLLAAQAGQVVALTDPDSRACSDAARLTTGATRAKVLGSFDELIEQAADLHLDGIVIATPSALHAEQATRALSAKLAVFCQKPLSQTADQARAIVGAARRADRLLGVDFSYRGVPGIDRARALMRQGALGELFAVDLTFHNAYGPDKPWFYDRAQSGGGCVMDLGCHLIDLLLYMTSDEAEIEVIDSRLFEGGQPYAPGRTGNQNVEDHALVTMCVRSGAVVRLACSWRLHAGCDAIIEAAFYGTKGSIRLVNERGSFHDLRVEHMTGTQSRLLGESRGEWNGATIQSWASRMAESNRFSVEADRFVDVATIIDRIYGASHDTAQDTSLAAFQGAVAHRRNRGEHIQ